MNIEPALRDRVSALLLVLITLAAIAGIDLLYRHTQEIVAYNARQATLKVINTVMPLHYDNDLTNDSISMDVPITLNPSGKILVFRARYKTQPVGAIFMPVITNGYNDDIHLVIGVDVTGKLTGVRVLQHKETKNIGDYIHQDRSDWILGFTHLSVTDITKTGWTTQVKKDLFHATSGATISSRSVMNVVHQLLVYYQERQQQIY